MRPLYPSSALALLPRKRNLLLTYRHQVKICGMSDNAEFNRMAQEAYAVDWVAGM